MSKKVKLSYMDMYWIEKLLKEELRNCKLYFELYPCPTRSHIVREVDACKEKIHAYEALLERLKVK